MRARSFELSVQKRIVKLLKLLHYRYGFQLL